LTSRPPNSRPRVLVAGVGNIFFGDDGFGSEVARTLLRTALPPHVQVVDYGIRGTHLAYDLLDGYDALILIDVLPGGAPGDVRAVDVDTTEVDGVPVDGVAVDAHGMDPRTVLASVRALGGTVPRVIVVGCAPVTVDEQLGLSPPVAAAVPQAAALVPALVSNVLDRQRV
jgi:hydrogenase maturation protease